MKPQNTCGESSLCEEPTRGFREMFQQAYQAAAVFMANQGDQRNRRVLLVSKPVERRRWSCSAEDPIRTLIFLGSWSHT
ncbi:hypothetical protein C1H46_042773 [Malus baccata]|uniref:Uncharacterized protein n=1 Tax=Malus baccata TaxID=106549 RepID=A0A540KBU5_MALBA|nr:hypothetical protein C1H46_042773 [Malus baccata]